MSKIKNRFYFALLLIVVSFVGVYSWLKVPRPFKPLDKTPTILFVFNGEYDSEAENSLASIKKNTPELVPAVTICVSDERSRAFANKHNLRSFELSTINETGTYLSTPMNVMGRRKIECIMHLLAQNEDVLYMDTDIVFLSNPLNEINTNYDINIQDDACSRQYKYSYLCTGFMYIKPNERTLRLLQQIIDEVTRQDYAINDQNALDILAAKQNLFKFYNTTGLSINVLDGCKFPNGCRYFDHTDRYCKKADSLIVHNNHIIGIEGKRKRFLKNGLIFSEYTQEEYAAAIGERKPGF